MPLSAINTTPTFNISASNGGGKFTINFEMLNCPPNYVGDIIVELSKGFRDIEVINSQTGEVAMSLYYSDEMFQELCPPEMCIDMVRHMCEKRGI